MKNINPVNWYEANKRYLMTLIAEVRASLEQHAGQHKPAGNRRLTSKGEEIKLSRQALPAPAALDILVSIFDLSPFERDILLLCAGIELDCSLAGYCAKAQGDSQHCYPTFSLALAVFPESHWSALTPDSPLRYWRLIEIGPGDSLTASPLRVDERILHQLIGVPHLDERLRGVLHAVKQPLELSPLYDNLLKRIKKIWSEKNSFRAAPVIQLCGIDSQLKRSIAAAGCKELGLSLYKTAVSELPSSAVERESFIRLWGREALLSGAALLLEYDNTGGPDHARHLGDFVRQAGGLILINTREPIDLGGKFTICLDVNMPTTSEQYAIWHKALGPVAAKLNGQLAPVVSQFRLSNSAIQAVGAEVMGCIGPEDEGGRIAPEKIGDILWDACRIQARPQLDDLAQRIRVRAGWNDLVLPQQQKKILSKISGHVRHQVKVYEEWGFAEQSTRGLGISALFSGPSGTGKTMAAEVLANELRLDLYRIDLSSVVSKYIGETEKQLRRVFDAAEQGGVILLFDEADALFGKRSEVKDSHDRYANIEVSYLLQRMEEYRGLAILTTNQKSALDTAFLRRIRFVIQFPFPDAGQRAEIWQRVFPRQTPTKNLNFQKLSRLNLAGGNIRNIALNAAFMAADQDRPVNMGDIKKAACTEYIKIEKTLSAAETRDWL